MRQTKFMLILIAGIQLTISSCRNREYPILITTTRVVEISQNQIRKDTTTTVDSEYFEVKLSSVNNDELYVAGKQLVKPQIGTEFKIEFFKLVDDKGKELEFKTPADFLNYMDKAGYEMKEQEK